jgi:hypothetical protein
LSINAWCCLLLICPHSHPFKWFFSALSLSLSLLSSNQVCPVGRYYSTQGTQTSCSACPPGMISSSKGATSCYACDSGTVPNEARTECVAA